MTPVKKTRDPKSLISGDLVLPPLMEPSFPNSGHFMQRAAVHILVHATCCAKVKRDAEADSIRRLPSGSSEEEQESASESGGDGVPVRQDGVPVRQKGG